MINNKTMKTTNVYLFAPLILGWLFGSICPVRGGPRTKSQPPGWVFGIVWPVLFLLIGFNWKKTADDKILSVLHLLLVTGLNLWVFQAGCKNNYRTGVLLFVPIIALTLAIWMKSSKLYSSGWWVMTPLLGWLLFAHQLNVHIVEKQ
jgi:tryptophan-rich sensory protein